MPKVDKWRLCWDYNKDAKAIIQSTLTNVVPFSEQMGPRVWVGKQAEYPSPSWLEENRINGKQGHCQDSPVPHVILCLRANLRQIRSFCCLMKSEVLIYQIMKWKKLMKWIYIFYHSRSIHSCCNKMYVYIKKRDNLYPLLICQSAPADGLRLARALWLQPLNYGSVKCRMLWAWAKQTRGCNKGCFPLCKWIRMACHSAGSRRAEALLKKSFRELRCPR